jgi:ABC-2 type transport system permease protein
MIGFLVVASGVVLLHGGNPYKLLWGPGSPLTLTAEILATVPVYAVWALPTVGWLMLCSAWAKSKPFLWAIMIPVFSGIFVAMFDLMQLFDLDTGWYWSNIVGRALAGVLPGNWLVMGGHSGYVHVDSVTQALSPATAWASLAAPGAWLGAIAGIAMIFGAIRLRRWRDDN